MAPHIFHKILPNFLTALYCMFWAAAVENCWHHSDPKLCSLLQWTVSSILNSRTWNVPLNVYIFSKEPCVKVTQLHHPLSTDLHQHLLNDLGQRWRLTGSRECFVERSLHCLVCTFVFTERNNIDVVVLKSITNLFLLHSLWVMISYISWPGNGTVMVVLQKKSSKKVNFMFNIYWNNIWLLEGQLSIFCCNHISCSAIQGAKAAGKPESFLMQRFILAGNYQWITEHKFMQ